MRPINSKLKLAVELADRSAALTSADLPAPPTANFRAALLAFESALRFAFGSLDGKSFGYDEDEGNWYASVRAPSILSVCDLADRSATCPYHITGDVYARGVTPQECVSNLISKYTTAEEWQRKVISLLNVDILKAKQPPP